MAEQRLNVGGTRVLTMRQFEVCEILATSKLCRKEISAKLNISKSTVHAHMNAAYEVLGINSKDKGMRDRCRLGLMLWWNENKEHLVDWPTYVRWVYDTTKGPSR